MILNDLLIVIWQSLIVVLIKMERERGAVSPDSASFSLLHTGRFPPGGRSGRLP